MSAATCATHPGAAAAFRCDGCAKPLCEECVEQGHRLLFCRLCGERALPLTAAEPATVPARRSAQRRAAAASYRFRDALSYPLRGQGGYAFWSLVALWALIALGSVVPFLGLAAGVLGLLLVVCVAVLLPRFLFEIAASTAAGEDELPHWPDLDLRELLGSVAHFLAVAAVCLLPGWLLARLAGCQWGGALGRDVTALCLVVLVAQVAIAAALWVPVYGAGAVYRTPWLFFRFDLHARAVAAAPGDWALTAGSIASLLAAGALLPAALGAVPLVGSLLGSAIQLYAVFLGAHLAGVWFRRHPEAMERAYLG